MKLNALERQEKRERALLEAKAKRELNLISPDPPEVGFPRLRGCPICMGAARVTVTSIGTWRVQCSSGCGFNGYLNSEPERIAYMGWWNGVCSQPAVVAELSRMVAGSLPAMGYESAASAYQRIASKKKTEL